MSFPTQPSVDIPRWAYNGGVYEEPSLTQRETGWQAVPGQNYAEPPPYQWVNWLGYSTGEWINYIAAYAIPYLQNGNFDGGINLFNNQPAKFYNAANDKYTSIKSAPSQSAASVQLTLPAALPTTPMPMVSDSSGNLSFSTISSSAVAGITNGSAPISGQVGEYYVSNFVASVGSSNIYQVSNLSLGPGVYRLSYSILGPTISNSGGGISAAVSTQNTGSSWPSDRISGYNALSLNNYSSQATAINIVLPAIFFNFSTISSIYLYVFISSPSYPINVPICTTIQRIS